jgi:hypothetical protein
METKVCRKCHLEKPVTEFGIADKARGYLKAQCRACESARVRAYYASNGEYREKSIAKSKRWAKENPRTPEQQRVAMLRQKYDLTTEQYETLRDTQGNKCRLCGSEDVGRAHGKWHRGHWMIDHCHEDGRVRGLLCHDCNTQLGGYEILLEKVGEAKLLDYLTSPSPVPPSPLPVVPMYRTMEPPPVYTPSPPCSVEGCEALSHADGLCQKHYTRVWRGRSDPGPAADLPKIGRKGSAHKLSKLTEDDVRAIRSSDEKGITLATRYGVTATLITNIRQHKTWRHVN